MRRLTDEERKQAGIVTAAEVHMAKNGECPYPEPLEEAQDRYTRLIADVLSMKTDVDFCIEHGSNNGLLEAIQQRLDVILMGESPENK